MRLEALKALHAAADAGHDGLSSRWAALCEAILANTWPWGGVQRARLQKPQQQQQTRHTAADKWTQHAPQPNMLNAQDGGNVQGAPQEANEQCALQALHLLASVLAEFSQPDAPSAASPAPALGGSTEDSRCGTAAIHGVSGCKMGGTHRNAAVRAWEDACARVLPDVMTSASAPVRAAAVAALAGVSPGVHDCISPSTRSQLWRWVRAAAKDEAAAPRAAAAKAASACAAVFVFASEDRGGHQYCRAYTANAKSRINARVTNTVNRGLAANCGEVSVMTSEDCRCGCPGCSELVQMLGLLSTDASLSVRIPAAAAVAALAEAARADTADLESRHPGLLADIAAGAHARFLALFVRLR